MAQTVKICLQCRKPGLGRSPGGGYGKPLQDSCLENPTDKEAWQVTVCGVQKSDMTKRLSTYISRLNQEEIENVNIPVTSPELGSVIKNLSTYKSFEADYFAGEFYQTFREELIIIPL